LLLEYYRFPKLFLRRSKNCYISLIEEDLLDYVLRIKPKVDVDVLKSALTEKGFGSKMMKLRKLCYNLKRKWFTSGDYRSITGKK